MTRMACSRDISVYYVSPLDGLGESFFIFSPVPLNRMPG